ncbi:B- and T-lymphocyte attenuator-like isoform X2 [Antennarius striatus]|uniref:B- and T-lymphocyte attenuator-like isoform X2 n=1 Tax=Antennarius striatus TaxID=241820 RepID=UPI0035B3733F
MVACFLRLPIMRPVHYCTVLHVSILAVLLLTLDADGEDPDCEDEIFVRRNTCYDAWIGDNLRINCTIQFCKNSAQTVRWFRVENVSVPVDLSSHISESWVSVHRPLGTSFLDFQSILITDAGAYQCRSGLSVSHVIHVFVHGKGDSGVTPTAGAESADTAQHPWRYLYIATGIAAFVIVVIIITVASMQGCKWKSKKENRLDDQRSSIPLTEHPLPHTGLRASPRGSPVAPPSTRSTRRKASPSKPEVSPLPSGRERQVEVETRSVLYAALNCQTLAAATRPRRPKEESTEYAVICVQEH